MFTPHPSSPATTCHLGWAFLGSLPVLETLLRVGGQRSTDAALEVGWVGGVRRLPGTGRWHRPKLDPPTGTADRALPFTPTPPRWPPDRVLRIRDYCVRGSGTPAASVQRSVERGGRGYGRRWRGRGRTVSPGAWRRSAAVCRLHAGCRQGCAVPRRSGSYPEGGRSTRCGRAMGWDGNGPFTG